MNRFRVATYNVHKCRGIDWKVRPERVLKVIQQMDADILAMQEVFAEQAECLAESTKMRHVFGPTRT